MYLTLAFDEHENARTVAASRIPPAERLLVFYRFDGEPEPPTLETPAEIFRKMDMDDCYPIMIDAIMRVQSPGDARRLLFRGTWHDGRDPLRMEIVDAETLETLATAWGSDH